ncbi:hypothetical protein CPAV1605_58 [seawater metagenome]|uniref:Uncharacterized protein n=1 Tax=seawater metagenome TaxID=1561972 RepID=A0A5E8CH34_9ZZZZ
MTRYVINYSQIGGKPWDFFYYNYFNSVLADEKIALLLVNFFKEGIKIDDLSNEKMKSSIRKYNTTFTKFLLKPSTVELLIKAAKELKDELMVKDTNGEDIADYFTEQIGDYAGRSLNTQVFDNTEIQDFYDSIPNIKENTQASLIDYLNFVLNEESILDIILKEEKENLDSRIRTRLIELNGQSTIDTHETGNRRLTFEKHHYGQLNKIIAKLMNFNYTLDDISKIIKYYNDGEYPEDFSMPDEIFYDGDPYALPLVISKKFKVTKEAPNYLGLWESLKKNDPNRSITIADIKSQIVAQIRGFSQAQKSQNVLLILSYWPGTLKLNDTFFDNLYSQVRAIKDSLINSFLEFYCDLLTKPLDEINGLEFKTTNFKRNLDNTDTIGGELEINIYAKLLDKQIKILGKENRVIKIGEIQHVLFSCIYETEPPMDDPNIIFIGTNNFYYYPITNEALTHMESNPQIITDNYYPFTFNDRIRTMTGTLTDNGDSTFTFVSTTGPFKLYSNIIYIKQNLAAFRYSPKKTDNLGYYMKPNFFLQDRLKKNKHISMKFKLDNSYFERIRALLNTQVLKLEVIDYQRTRDVSEFKFTTDIPKFTDFFRLNFAVDPTPQINFDYVTRPPNLTDAKQIELEKQVYELKLNSQKIFYPIHFLTLEDGGRTLREVLKVIDDTGSFGLKFEAKNILLVSKIILSRLTVIYPGAELSLTNIRILSGVNYQFGSLSLETDLIILDNDNRILAIGEIKSFIDGIQKGYKQLKLVLAYLMSTPNPIFTDVNTHAEAVVSLHPTFLGLLNAESIQTPENIPMCIMILGETHLQNFCDNNEEDCYNTFLRDLYEEEIWKVKEDEPGYEINMDKIRADFDTKIKKLGKIGDATILDKQLYKQDAFETGSLEDIEITKDFIGKYLGKDNLIIVKRST